jgi:hypothetical protein
MDLVAGGTVAGGGVGGGSAETVPAAQGTHGPAFFKLQTVPVAWEEHPLAGLTAAKARAYLAEKWNLPQQIGNLVEVDYEEWSTSADEASGKVLKPGDVVTANCYIICQRLAREFSGVL